MFNREHWLLVGGWILFSVLHSLFASKGFKSFAAGILKARFRFYRFAYSVFAFITLGLVLILQFSIQSSLLWVQTTIIVLVVLPFLLLGLYVMGASIYKYFYYLSGIDVFAKRPAPTILQTGGLHRFVRHPLYSGTLVFVWALFFLFPYLSNLIACAIISIYTIAGIVFEEKKLVAEFGEQYKKYASSVPMLIPKIFH